ncbi:DNA polymerase/primase [Mycobacterium phage DS6A]|uniref:DNA primase n=1 Tax=Mycobacterium phage DS6A TaxID=45764 RepID=G8I4J5_9CAUD|nr:DNA polymerase/primase [Mycobacterium phage DS6A]AER47639.1 DNA primase [Mycobacterium phage DS6A]
MTAETFDLAAWVEANKAGSKPPAATARPPGTYTPPAPPAGADRYAAAALADECREVAATTEGGRNHRLNTAAFNLGSLIEAGALNRTQVEHALRDAARACGLTEAEIGPTIASGFRSAATKVGPRVIPDAPPALDLGNTTLDPGELDAAAAGDDDGAPPADVLEQLEGDFWQRRPSLNLIYTAALSRLASPWAVFACCCARVVADIPPTVQLPAIIGGRGSLNLFAAISAKSGGGKGAAMAVADALTPNRDLEVRSIGSGEGMIEAYRRDTKKNGGDDDGIDGPDDSIVTSILFSIEEIDSLGAMGGRSGQTTMTVLRQGFSGEKLGFTYRGRQHETVPAHTYRMTVVAAVQPERAGTLFEDAGGGTPQRFAWFPGRDRRITADPPDWPADRAGQPAVIPRLSNDHKAQAAGVVDVPNIVVRTVREARAASMSGDDNALDGHALFTREKYAYALAVLDGRTHMTDEDWELSGVVAAVSDWCRDKALEGYQAGRHRAAADRGELRAVEDDERNAVAAMRAEKAVQRIAGLIVKHLGDAGGFLPWAGRGGLRQKLGSRDRARAEAALQALVAAERITARDDGWALK